MGVNVGQQVNEGFSLQDSAYINGIAAGTNAPTATLTAHAGGGQSAATQIPTATLMVNLGTVATAGDSIVLPPAVPGLWGFVLNATATSANLYANPNTNRKNGSTLDIIIGAGTSNVNTAAVSLAANTAYILFCSVVGIWGIK